MSAASQPRSRALFSSFRLHKGRTIRKVMGGGGGGGKSKNRAGGTEKKFVHQKSLKKKFVQRLFNRENYKLTGPIRGTV